MSTRFSLFLTALGTLILTLIAQTYTVDLCAVTNILDKYRNAVRLSFLLSSSCRIVIECAAINYLIL